MKTVNLSKDPTEYESAKPEKEKHAAVGSAVIGGLLGGLLLFIVCTATVAFMQVAYGAVLVVMGTAVGIFFGALAGPLVSLRLTRLRQERQRGRQPTGELSRHRPY